ncbi:methylenetetrahydrofolate reductase (NADPH) [Candidatus Magnetomoraceae bacterium gMMP-15]
MIRFFRDDILNPDIFVITLELVPGRESKGRSVDTVMKIASDAYSDGRVSAVSITDNPGGNPSLSPDVIGHEIFKLGMDVIVHFTCRDMNRVGMESRALQLDSMGMKNILALTGDYSGKGFGGQGAPVFDLDSVNLVCMLKNLSKRIKATEEDPENFLIGCAISPFKRNKGECYAQYSKLYKKVAAGADFIITQLGYDVEKFRELLEFKKYTGITLPTLASLYMLTPASAKVMNSGRVPGAVVTDKLLNLIQSEWKDKKHGRNCTIERSARLGVVLKGLGYNGLHISGIHKSFEPVAKILDRMEEIKDQWQEFLVDFDFPQKNGFYLYQKNPETGLTQSIAIQQKDKAPLLDRVLFKFLSKMHNIFFNFNTPYASFFEKLCLWLDKRHSGKLFVKFVENLSKQLLLSCQGCGDCGVQHIAFLCPESQCPKHTRNGPCGGSTNGMCEVYPDRQCVWVRAYKRLASINQSNKINTDFVPPRMWELNQTSSWINFHLHKDHQSVSGAIATFCTRKNKQTE